MHFSKRTRFWTFLCIFNEIFHFLILGLLSLKNIASINESSFCTLSVVFEVNQLINRQIFQFFKWYSFLVHTIFGKRCSFLDIFWENPTIPRKGYRLDASVKPKITLVQPYRYKFTDDFQLGKEWSDFNQDKVII